MPDVGVQACVAHEVIDGPRFTAASVGGVSFSEALASWFYRGSAIQVPSAPIRELHLAHGHQPAVAAPAVTNSSHKTLHRIVVLNDPLSSVARSLSAADTSSSSRVQAIDQHDGAWRDAHCTAQPDRQQRGTGLA